MQLPEPFCTTVAAAFDGGAAWLDALPAHIKTFEQRWQIEVGDPFTLSYNFAAAATGPNGEPYVLKLGVPRDELTREIAALKLYDGRGICRLIASDAAAGALLLERVQPGDMLSTLSDPAEAARVGAEMMASLWQPLPDAHAFRPISEWTAGLSRLRPMFDGGTGPLPERLVNSAETAFAHLNQTAAPAVLLHGDLHHYNILRDGRGWRVIDPKGMSGELAYETGTFISNHLAIYGADHEPLPLINICIDLFAKRLSIDAERIRLHAFAQAVLSAFWSIEDTGSGYEHALAVAQLLMP